MKWRHWKKWALVGGIILIGCSARFLSISQIEKIASLPFLILMCFNNGKFGLPFNKQPQISPSGIRSLHKSMQLLKHFLMRNPSARPNGNATITAVNGKISS